MGIKRIIRSCREILIFEVDMGCIDLQCVCFFVQVCVEYFRSGVVVAFCAAAPFEGMVMSRRGDVGREVGVGENYL
ncbi:hypothetical protein [Bartonella tribocorum]|uniref:hypothetical protein n=1 Tax=Bartonella tribocorum TaxID=85701 RepID=UPI0013053568|nr:hypothetical protein [Bartonella tribocorum]